MTNLSTGFRFFLLALLLLLGANTALGSDITGMDGGFQCGPRARERLCQVV